ncbi:hypothetical protein Tco_0436489 [Tanacetum coccineum]
MTVSTRNTHAVVDDVTRQNLTDLVQELVTNTVNYVVERLWQDLMVDNIVEDCKDVDWNVYKAVILKRFDVAYDDPLGEIKKLKQTNQVYGLCKLEEAKLNALKKKPKPPILPTPRYQTQYPNTGPKLMAFPAPNANWRTKLEIADGNQSTSIYMCKRFKWKLHEEEFHTDVMLIPLGGCEMVLRIQWLFTLGNILSNFKELIMKFKYNGRKVVLRGTQKANLHWMHGSKMLIQTPHVELSSMVLCVYPTTTLHMIRAEESKEVPKGISQLIPLKEGTTPINSRPYRHPLTQKDVVEAMVKELLDTGVIRNIQSLFSSPVIMVKKKDETWRMCIGYRKLNNATIKDTFPISIIEELIDELQGYYQIM